MKRTTSEAQWCLPPNGVSCTLHNDCSDACGQVAARAIGLGLTLHAATLCRASDRPLEFCEAANDGLDPCTFCAMTSCMRGNIYECHTLVEPFFSCGWYAPSTMVMPTADRAVCSATSCPWKWSGIAKLVGVANTCARAGCLIGSCVPSEQPIPVNISTNHLRNMHGASVLNCSDGGDREIQRCTVCGEPYR